MQKVAEIIRKALQNEHGGEGVYYDRENGDLVDGHLDVEAIAIAIVNKLGMEQL